ncbi:hypothetical protein JNJ66_07005 [Candidatus Saccharibacteria bacterium]|nr:hypothetical protein [Candidatus Saccharibacteria bacterium]
MVGAAVLAVKPLAVYAAATCGNVPVAIDPGCRGSDNPIIGYIAGITTVLSVMVGVLVISAIIAGGIMYSTARGSQSQVQKAIEIIRNAVIGLILYIFMGAILQFFIPGIFG